MAHDFLRRLAKDPTRLKIFGDGQQTKPYIHIEDVLAAFRLMEREQASGYDVFNVGTEDSLTVPDVADIVVERMGLSGVRYEFTGGLARLEGRRPGLQARYPQDPRPGLVEPPKFPRGRDRRGGFNDPGPEGGKHHAGGRDSPRLADGWPI